MTTKDEAKAIRRRFAGNFSALPQKMRWGKWRNIFGLVELCRSLPRAGGLEVGSFAGESTVIFLECVAPRMVCVDRWALPHWHPAKIVEAEKAFDELCRCFHGRIDKRRGQSREILAQLAAEGRRFEWAYIDADHTREGVTADILGALPLLVPGGILCGHDYGRSLWPGVKEAVDSTIGQPDRVFADSSWLRRLT